MSQKTRSHRSQASEGPEAAPLPVQRVKFLLEEDPDGPGPSVLAVLLGTEEQIGRPDSIVVFDGERSTAHREYLARLRPADAAQAEPLLALLRKRHQDSPPPGMAPVRISAVGLKRP